ncbi:MAG TPA: thioredoxin, partial [Candidatus Rokubacteria bacterium]|nr:thioredoxin [Candidatus Rokubacteria bacterium]
MSTDLKTKVQELIDTMINPAIANHGGFVELI